MAKKISEAKQNGFRLSSSGSLNKMANTARKFCVQFTEPDSGFP